MLGRCFGFLDFGARTRPVPRRFTFAVWACANKTRGCADLEISTAKCGSNFISEDEMQSPNWSRVPSIPQEARTAWFEMALFRICAIEERYGVDDILQTIRAPM